MGLTFFFGNLSTFGKKRENDNVKNLIFWLKSCTLKLSKNTRIYFKSKK